MRRDAGGGGDGVRPRRVLVHGPMYEEIALLAGPLERSLQRVDARRSSLEILEQPLGGLRPSMDPDRRHPSILPL